MPGSSAWSTSARARHWCRGGGLEPVIDSGGGEHSVFAKAFLDALTENRDVLDGQAMFAAVKRPVALESDQTPQYSDIRPLGSRRRRLPVRAAWGEELYPKVGDAMN